MKTEEMLQSMKLFQAGTLSTRDTNALFSCLTEYIFNNSWKFGLQKADRDDLSQKVTVQIFSFLKANPNANIYTLGFIHISIKNAFINMHRKEKKVTIIGEEHIPAKICSYNSFEEENALEYWKRVLGKYIPKEQCDAFVLCIQGYKYEEISKEIDIPIGTVRSRIHRAREILKHTGIQSINF